MNVTVAFWKRSPLSFRKAVTFRATSVRRSEGFSTRSSRSRW